VVQETHHLQLQVKEIMAAVLGLVQILVVEEVAQGVKALL
jgi:hypothetical protein